MCLIDAEDYSDLPIRQYEEDNVLRELNKAYLAFSRIQSQSPLVTKASEIPAAHSTTIPVQQLDGAENVASPPSLPAAVRSGILLVSPSEADLTINEARTCESADQVASCCCGENSSLAVDAESLVNDDSANVGSSCQTLLYGGGRNVPLTLAKATMLKELDVNDNDPQLTRKNSFSKSCKDRNKEGSVFKSCHSDEQSSGDSVEFRSARTSLDANDELGM